MIEALTGRIVRVSPEGLTLEVGPVTLRLVIPPGSGERFGRPGQVATVFTSLQVRDDGVTLYGFPAAAERDLFEVLLDVSRVGPKAALSIIGRLGPDRFWQAVGSGDATLLGAVPGIGKKTAERLIFELRGRLPEAQPAAGAPEDAELLAALTALGYSTAEALAAIRAVPPADGLSLEERLRRVLAAMAGRPGH
jgi:Holliday junction DNA helicase RuvA